MTRVRGSSNAKAKSELSWQPKYTSWREGFQIVARLGITPEPAAERPQASLMSGKGEKR